MFAHKLTLFMQFFEPRMDLLLVDASKCVFRKYKKQAGLLWFQNSGLCMLKTLGLGIMHTFWQR